MKYARFYCSLLLLCAFNTVAGESWLLSYQDKSTNNFIWDKRTPKLIKATIPREFANDLLAGLGGPPDPIYFTNERYFSASACVPHACGNKSFYWYDMQTGMALGAILEDWGSDVTLTLSSLTVAQDNIPEAAILDMTRWLTDLGSSPESVVFLDKLGNKTNLSPSNFQPRKSYISAPNGPSFDCAIAVTVVEKSICGSAELSKLDLDLSELLHAVHYGNSTLKSRNELDAFQRNWIKDRDYVCSSSKEIEICLTESYMSQHNALMNWIPSN